MQKGAQRLALAALLIGVASSIFAQGLPTTQPSYLLIVREEVKIGRSADHEKLEAGWPAAYEKAKSTDYYLAFESITGPNEAWYVGPYDSHAALGETMKREDTDPVLSAELKRLARADAEHLNGVRVMQARARKELTHGAFPDIGKVRFSEITWVRVRPGHEAGFEAAVKAFGAAAQRSGANTSYRIYEIIAGAPSPAYLVFSTVSSFAEFDQLMAAGDKVMTSLTPQEGAAMQSFFKEGLINFETQRFRVNPVMSYVPKETRAQDPDFWMPKKPAAKTSQD